MASPNKSVLFCLAPIVNLGLVVGVLPCRVVTLRGNQQLQIKIQDLCYSIVYCSLMAVFFQWAVIDLIRMYSWKKLEFIAFLSAFGQVYGLFLVALIAMITGWLNRWRVARIVQRIVNVDALLWNMEIGVDYRSIRKKLVIQLTGLSLVPFGASMVNCFVLNQKTSFYSLCYFFICFLPILVITFKEFQYYNSVLLIRQKIQMVNKKLGILAQETDSEEQQCDTSFVSPQIQPVVMKSQANILQNLSQIHAELMDILKEIQSIFGPHLLASILTAFGVIITQLYYLITGIVHELHYNVIMICMTLSWVAIQMLLILINVVVCSKTNETVRRDSC